MRSYTTFADLESPLEEQPLFYVEPHGKPPVDPKLWPEDFRQKSFVAFIRKHAPAVVVSSFANEGKRTVRNGQRMKALGMTPGMPDICTIWDGGTAFLEFKGFSADGRPGRLSQQQIATLNRIHRNGWSAGCFFTASRAIDWLADLGAPVPRRRA